MNSKNILTATAVAAVLILMLTALAPVCEAKTVEENNISMRTYYVFENTIDSAPVLLVMLNILIRVMQFS